MRRIHVSEHTDMRWEIHDVRVLSQSENASEANIFSCDPA